MSKINVVIEANSVEEFQTILRGFLGGEKAVPQEPSASASVASPVSVSASTGAETPTAPSKGKRGRPPKAEKQGSPAANPEGVAAPKVVEEKGAVTFDQVKSAIQNVATLKDGDGMEDAEKLISEYGYLRVRDIKPEHFQEIYDKAQELIKAAG